MIKENVKRGETLVCIKDFFFEDDIVDVLGNKILDKQPILILAFKKTNHYKVKYTDHTYNSACIQGENNISIWFNITMEEDIDKDKPIIFEHFTTLAEWRDMQINSILEDETE